jgi:hypothetical protein
MHSLLVPLVLNVGTGKISPQYYVIFEICFETVLSLPVGDTIQQQWHWIFNFPREFYLDVDLDWCRFPLPNNVTNDHSTNLHLPFELPLRSLPSKDHTDLPFFTPASNTTNAPAGAPEGSRGSFSGKFGGNSNKRPKGLPQQVSAANNFDVMTGDDTVVLPPLWPGDTSDDHPTTVLPSSCPGRQNVGTHKGGPAKIRRLPIGGQSYKLNILLDNACDTPAAFIMNQGHICCQPQPHCILKSSLLECTLLQEPWEQSIDSSITLLWIHLSPTTSMIVTPVSLQPNLLPQSTIMTILLMRWLCVALSKWSTVRQ